MIDLVLEAKTKDLGGGLVVGRVLPHVERRMVGPFTFLDHIGPAVLEPGQGVDVRPHPHIGLATITYLFEGEIVHRDNLGSHQTIVPGEVNWMTAGRGIVHSERTDPAHRATRRGLHGLQAWVALPREHEDTAPSFHHHTVDELPSWPLERGRARLIAGEAFGRRAPFPTHSPLFYVHFALEPGARVEIDDEHEERAVFVAAGTIELAGRTFHEGQLAIFAPGTRPTLVASTQAIVAALGGAPVGARILWWNFVASTRDAIERAQAEWAAGRMPLPPGDDQEWIPLPDHPVPPEPMS